MSRSFILMLLLLMCFRLQDLHLKRHQHNHKDGESVFHDRSQSRGSRQSREVLPKMECCGRPGNELRVCMCQYESRGEVIGVGHNTTTHHRKRDRQTRRKTLIWHIKKKVFHPQFIFLLHLRPRVQRQTFAKSKQKLPKKAFCSYETMWVDDGSEMRFHRKLLTDDEICGRHSLMQEFAFHLAIVFCGENLTSHDVIFDDYYLCTEYVDPTK